VTRVFTKMEIWVEVRRRVLTGELSKRAACREYEIHWQTLEKILSHAEPPGYQKTKPRSSIVDAFEPIIEEILNSDRQVHRKQRHTARRIFERLRDEHGYVGGETIVNRDTQFACEDVNWYALPECFTTFGYHVGGDVNQRATPMRCSSICAASDCRRRCAGVITGVVGSSAFCAAMNRSIASWLVYRFPPHARVSNRTP